MLTIGEVKDDISRIEAEISDLGEALIESLDSVVGLDAQTEIARKLKALIAKGYRAHRYLSHVQEEEITYLRKIINGRVAMTKEFIATQDAEIARLRDAIMEIRNAANECSRSSVDEALGYIEDVCKEMLKPKEGQR